MGSEEAADYSPAENAEYIKRSYLKNGAYAFIIMVIFVLLASLYPPFQQVRSYLQIVAYLVGGTAAGYYFSQDLDRRNISFQTRDGLILWLVSSVGLLAGIFAAGIPVRVLIQGQGLVPALNAIVNTIFGQIDPNNAGLVLAILGIAMGHDMYHQQFTMLKPLSRETRKEVREISHSLQPLVEARHKYGRSFTPVQLEGLLLDETQRGSMGETLSGLRDQGIIEMGGGMITITGKGENLLSISRFVGGMKEGGEEGADLCAYCGHPLKLSEKLLRINYYGEPRLMHYTEREGVRIFGRLPYIDKVLDLKPAEVSRPFYERARVIPTVDHKAALALGIIGAAFAMISYSWMILNSGSLPIPTEVSFFGGTLLSVSLIFAFCGLAGGLLTFLHPESSYGGAMMLALLFFALPFVGLTMQTVFGGHYAAVGLIAVGGLISVKARTRIG